LPTADWPVALVVVGLRLTSTLALWGVSGSNPNGASFGDMARCHLFCLCLRLLTM
jgi:hypothetical protein